MTFQPGLMNGKCAFVAGGTSGINKGIAHRLSEAGAKVAILGRNADKAHAARDEIAAATGNTVLALTADVRDVESYKAALESARSALGTFDVLVNGAAGNFPAPALAISPNGFKSVVDIDLLGTFHGCRLGFEHLTVPGAVVINISAPQAYAPSPLQVHVCAAKAGVDMVTRVLAMEWGPAGVRVNSIVPGAVDDTEGMERLAPNKAIREKLTAKIPLQRFATTRDIADMALFLCSPAASYVTGAVLVVDGGMSLGGMNLLDVANA
jgi:NAD(P)-dependent dehydrogenase (short-subunit alcohol dehydrogenase family)